MNKKSKKNQNAEQPVSAHLQVNEIVQLPIELIEVVPQQRTVISQEEVQELATNIQSVGLIHPILVRKLPNGKYQLVSGERRFLASKILNLNFINATVKDLTDEEAAEIQLSENLLRVDVTPLDEAKAFLKEVESGKSLNELTVRYGKSAKYIAGRISLNNLIQEFQVCLLDDKLPLLQAIYLSRQSQLNQALYHNATQDYYNVTLGDFKALKNYFETKIEVSLSTTFFDLNNDNLLENVKSCHTCVNNSANSLELFADKASPVCLNKECFHLKTLAGRKLSILALASNIYPVHAKWGISNEDSHVYEAIKDSIHVNDNNIIDIILHKPSFEMELPVLEDYDGDEEQFNQDNEEYHIALNQYEADLQDYEQQIVQDNVLNGYWISGTYRHTYFYFIKIESQSEISGDDFTPTIETNTEITAILDNKKKLQDRIIRGRELDIEKIHKAQIDKLSQLPQFGKSIVDSSDLNPAEQDALFIMIYSQLEWTDKNALNDSLSISLNSIPEQYNSLIGLSQAAKNVIVRQVLKKKVFNVFTGDLFHKSVTEIAVSYAEEIGLDQIHSDQNEICKMREQRAEDRILLMEKDIERIKQNMITEETLEVVDHTLSDE